MDDNELNSVELAVNAYLDYLEGVGPRPTFADLLDADRRCAVAVINIVLAGQGNDLDRVTPTVEELLEGTEFQLRNEPDPE
ncbi:hypothetical protein AAHS21_14410 [Mycobacterium sp. 050272]|uniref:hypothetical protein n=1 Tax=Mycobacterium sp. 050272 TaxID=3142488 RepID=UPI003189C6BA